MTFYPPKKWKAKTILVIRFDLSYMGAASRFFRQFFRQTVSLHWQVVRLLPVPSGCQNCDMQEKFMNWQEVHYLNYLAFLLVSIHAPMICIDIIFNIMRVLALAMAVTVITIFIHKRSVASEKKGDEHLKLWNEAAY